MTAPPVAPVRANQARHSGADVADPGRTSIADRVVTKVAAQACREVDHVHGVTPALPGRVLSQDPAVQVDAASDGHLVQLRVQIAVDYPVSLLAVTRSLRSHLASRMKQLCELTVTDIDVVIDELRYDITPPRRVQ